MRVYKAYDTSIHIDGILFRVVVISDRCEDDHTDCSEPERNDTVGVQMHNAPLHSVNCS